MFTGIVEGVGEVVGLERRGEVLRLRISVPVALTGIGVGDSISVSGICLTVTEIEEGRVLVEVSRETMLCSTLGDLKVGDRVNLERALEVGGRFGGHFVTGHVDGTGEVLEVRRGPETMKLRIRAPEGVVRYLVEKGSVAVDGVSLTVNAVRGDEFEVMIIPYTAQRTTLSHLKGGDRVNLEADILAKYVEKFLGRPGGRIDEAFLAEHGFLR
ncbi:MAG: riboflavin synthase [Deltaproteobacteria bacterium]|nr:MAG: riboflavin synthase [Deltaproteobacteria bacterium]RLB01687.1 MAG: riboflavin synthase [Deltaproteobacteria bacterium]